MGNRNLSTMGITTPTTRRGPGTSGYILWRCDANNKAAREKGESVAALTTGDLPTSTLEWSRPHSHAPVMEVLQGILNRTFAPFFEKGAYVAAKDVFSRIREEGCFFHMAKRLDLPTKCLYYTISSIHGIG